ncbi:unnamed protein product [Paramecium sonneborni]|uniref:Uncharacterized protein n=1 Tax=Paramecium sonneborni TaxID=65129 RepID=A0A8S1K1Q5_9CILI|nr:unnamed protein product [Paramecium sonneborni]
MFVIQLIGALIVLIIETFNRIEFKQSLIYFYYRYGTSLREPINDQIQIENQHTLIYQIKAHFQQMRQLDNECTYLKYLEDESILFQYHIDCAIDAHLNNNIIYIIDYNNCTSTLLKKFQVYIKSMPMKFSMQSIMDSINWFQQNLYFNPYIQESITNHNL